MIVLDSGDKIRGDASVASVVDYTLYGLSSGSTLSQMANGQLADSEGDLYTSPADATVVTTLVLVNTDSSARSVQNYSVLHRQRRNHRRGL